MSPGSVGKKWEAWNPNELPIQTSLFISLPEGRFILDPGILAKPTDSIAGKAKAPNDPRKNNRRFI
jgi:hypothetical protein